MNKPYATRQPHVHAEVICAWAAGADIETYSKSIGGWVKCPNPCWFKDEKYRVKPEVTHKIGNKYNNGTYLLASVGDSQVSLIEIETGRRWSKNVTVADVNSITEEEFSSLCVYRNFILDND